jgi:hypothetical protein
VYRPTLIESRMILASGPPCCGFAVESVFAVGDAEDAEAAGEGLIFVAEPDGGNVPLRRRAVLPRHRLQALLLVAELLRRARLSAGKANVRDMTELYKVNWMEPEMKRTFWSTSTRSFWRCAGCPIK